MEEGACSAVSYQDRSVSEIESSFSEHFQPGDFSDSESEAFRCDPPTPLQSLPPAISGSLPPTGGRRPTGGTSTAAEEQVSAHHHHNQGPAALPAGAAKTTDPDTSSEAGLPSLEAESLTEYPAHVVLEQACTNAAQLRQLSVEEGEETDCDDITLQEKEELGYESSLCDSTIQQEAKKCASAILQMGQLDPLSDSLSERLPSDLDLERSIFEPSLLPQYSDSGGEFIVDGSAESFIRIEDFGGGANSYFQIPPDFRLPLSGSDSDYGLCDANLTAGHNIEPTCRSIHSGKLSPIVEGPESSVCSLSLRQPDQPADTADQEEDDRTISSSTLPPCPQQHNNKSRPFHTTTSHVPRILNPTSPRDSTTGHNISAKKPKHKFGSRVESALPSRSNPSTPRDSDSERQAAAADESPPLHFLPQKQKIVAKRYIRSSPPRETAAPPFLTTNSRTPPTPQQQQPEHTRTGLVLTKPFRTTREPAAAFGSRSASSVDLLLPLNRSYSDMTISIDRAKSASTCTLNCANGRLKAPSTRLPDFSHVESKVKQYIHSVKAIGEENGRRSRRTPTVMGRSTASMQKSKSCGNLSPSRRGFRPRRNSVTEFPPASGDQLHLLPPRPRTAPSSQDLADCQEQPEPSPLPLDKSDGDIVHNCDSMTRHDSALRQVSLAHSKSVPNLCSKPSLHTGTSGGASFLSKSAMSLAALGCQLRDLVDSEDSDYEAKVQRYFSRDNLSEIIIESEDLVNLVVEERRGKQEAKKVLKELQTNYDTLLQKFAAAENALDQVRFGGLPPTDDSREETFRLAESFAERLGRYKQEEHAGGADSSLDGLLRSVHAREASAKPSSRDTGKDSELDSGPMTDVQKQSLNIINQAIGLEMAVSSGILEPGDAERGLEDLSSSFHRILNVEMKEDDASTRELLLEARNKLTEIRRKFRRTSQAAHIISATLVGDDNSTASPVLSAIEKVVQWRRKLPPLPCNGGVEAGTPHGGLPSCYSSLPSSPAPSQDLRACVVQQDMTSSHALHQRLPASCSPLDLDSGCPGSDRSTLWTSANMLHAKGLSPSGSKSKVGSRENVGSSCGPLYNLEEEVQQPASGQTSHRSMVGSRASKSPTQPAPVATSPQNILAINNRFVSNVTIETGIRLSPRALQHQMMMREKQKQSQADTARRNLESSFQMRNRREDSGLVRMMTNREPRRAHEDQYRGFVADLEQGGGNCVTSTPERRSHMKRSAGLYDIKAAAAALLPTAAGPPVQQLVRSPPSGQSPYVMYGAYVTDYSSDEEDMMLGLSDERLVIEDKRINIHPAYEGVQENIVASPLRVSAADYQTIPGGSSGNPSLAQQIDKEILELRNFFEDHREEMMSLIYDPQGLQAETTASIVHRLGTSSMSTQSCEPEDGRLRRSHSASSLQRGCTDLPQLIGRPQDSESDLPDRTLQLRRIEFEKRRMRRELRRHRKRQHSRGHTTEIGEQRLWMSRQLGGDMPWRMRLESRQRSAVGDRHQRSGGGGHSWPFVEPPPSDGLDENKILNHSRHFDDRQSFNQPSISAFFPSLERRGSSTSDRTQRNAAQSYYDCRSNDEDDNISSYPSLPPPPCPSTPARKGAPVTTSSPRQRVAAASADVTDWKVPRLDLDDIWSDATLPGSCSGAPAADLSLASTQEQQRRCSSPIAAGITSPPPSNLRRHPVGQSSPSSDRHGLASVRSIGCDTGDLELPQSRGVLDRRDWGSVGVGYLPVEIQSSRDPSSTASGGPHLELTSRLAIRRAYSADQMAELNSHLRSGSSVQIADDCQKILGSMRGRSESPVIIIQPTSSNTTHCTHHKSGRRGRKKNKDLDEILKSLDAANELAQKLKRRSEQMLDILTTEISHMHRDRDANPGLCG